MEHTSFMRTYADNFTLQASIQVLGLSGIDLNGIHESPSTSSIPLCEGDLICLAKRFFRMRYPDGMFAPLPKRIEEPQAATGESPAKENVGTPARRRVRMSLVAAAEVYSPPLPASLPPLAPSFAQVDSPRYVAPEQSIRIISTGSSNDDRAENAKHSVDYQPVSRPSLSPRKSALASPTKEAAQRKAKRASFAPVLEMGPTGSPLLGPQGFMSTDYFGQATVEQKEEEVNDLILIEEVEEEETDEEAREEMFGEMPEEAPEEASEEVPQEEPQYAPEENVKAAQEELPSTPTTPAHLPPSLSPRKSGRKVSLRTETLLKTSGSAFRLFMPETMLTPRQIPLPASLPASPAASSHEEEHSDADEEDEVDRSLSFADSPARASSGFSGERQESQEVDEEPIARQPLGAFMTPQVKRTKSVLTKPRGRVSLGAANGHATSTPKRSRRSFVRSFSLLREDDQVASEEQQHDNVHRQLTDRLQELEEAAEDALTDDEEAGAAKEDAQPIGTFEEVPVADEVAVDEPITTEGDKEETEAESQQPTASEGVEASEITEMLPEETPEQPKRHSRAYSNKAAQEEIVEVAAPAEEARQEDAQADSQSAPMLLEASSEEGTDVAEPSVPAAKTTKRGGRRAKTTAAAEKTTEVAAVEPPAPKKATRGRKAKASTAEDSASNAKPSDEANEEKPAEVSEEATEAASDAPIAPKKAARGRKAKEVVIETATSEAEPTEEVKEEKAKAPRKKAAPKGKKAVKVADEEVKEAVQDEPAADEQPRAKATKRAAPKKAKEAEVEAAPLGDTTANVMMPSSEADLADNEASSPIKKVARGGKRTAAKKAASTISDIASGVPMTTDAEGNLVAVEDENVPAAKTRSTRASARTTRSRRA